MSLASLDRGHNLCQTHVGTLCQADAGLVLCVPLVSSNPLKPKFGTRKVPGRRWSSSAPWKGLSLWARTLKAPKPPECGRKGEWGRAA